MDIGKAFSFPFEDEQWVASILIGGLLSLIPILGQILLIGYTLETARNVAAGNPRPLPKWNNFGDKLSLGFGGFVIALGYALPLIILGTLLVCVTGALGGAAGNDDAAAALVGGLFLCIFPLILLLALVLAPFVLAAQVRYLQSSSIGEAFNLGAVIATVRQDLGGWLVLWLLSILCGLVGSLGSAIIIGFIFTYPYSQAVFGHLMGQKLQSLGRPSGFDYAPPAAPTSF
jgi:hypothetical protein